MKHNIRINGQVKEIDCELGSGVLDKNGREIFEGDKVKFEYDGIGEPIIGEVEISTYDFDVWDGQVLNGGLCHCSKDIEIIDD